MEKIRAIVGHGVVRRGGKLGEGERRKFDEKETRGRDQLPTEWKRTRHEARTRPRRRETARAGVGRELGRP